MEYKRLIELDNQYPNLRNYKKGTTDNTGVLYGLYPETNKIAFTFPTIDNLNWVPGTDFRFILVIRNTITDTNPKLYTSEAYYNDLVASINEINPYFSAASFNPAYVVNITISELLTTYTDLQKLENKDAVLMNRNIFINADDTMDYDSLITYIDWVVSKVDPLDTDNGGVIQETVLSNWNYYSIDPVTQIVTNKILDVPTSQTADSAAYAQAQLNAANAGQNVSLQNSKQSELNDLLNQINSLETEIKSKANYIYTNKFLKFLFSGSVKVNNFTFTAPNGSKESVTKNLTDQLTTKLNDLKSKQVTLQSDISSLSASSQTNTAINGGINTSNISNTIGQAAAGIAAAQGIANAVTSLVGKIPKTLPTSLPQLPKLPNSIGDLVPKVSLPAVPKLPKKPEIPKIPSLKLPPVPTFKPKLPKVPKKFKKGLAGLKDATAAAQGAVAGAQGAVAGAMASAQGAVAAAQNAATSAVNSAKTAATSVVSQAQSSVNSAVASAQNQVADIQKNIPTPPKIDKLI